MITERFPVFSDVAEEQQHLLNSLRPVQFEKDSILFFQGDICKDILLLTSGCVRVYLQNDEGEEITLYALEPGEQCIVNTSSVISQSPAIGTAVCETTIEGYLVERNIIRQLIVDSPSYQEFTFGLFALKFSALTELVEDIRFRPLEQRLLKWLKSRTDNPVTVTHEHIAHHLGTSRVVISRLLKKLEENGNIKRHRGLIEVL